MTQTTTAERIAGLFYVALDLGSGEWIATIQTAEVIAAEIDAAAKARATWQAKAEMWRGLHDTKAEQLTLHETALRSSEAALAEARAEVERLTPAAEAWEAQEAWRTHDGRDRAGLAKLYTRRNDAAARAREAAKGTP